MTNIFTTHLHRVACALLIALFVPFVSHAASTEEAYAKHEQLRDLQALYEHIVRTYNLEDNTPLTEQEARVVIESGVQWIQNTQEEDGRFKYEFAPYDDVYMYGDNIVRQAGTLYALGEVLQHDPEGKYELRDTMKASMDRFVSFTKEDTFLGVEFQCFTETLKSDRCRLGAVSLALVAFISYVDAFPEEADEYADIIDEYAMYIANSKSLKTGFRESHKLGKNAQPSAQSPYSDGEALLALVRYYQYKPSSMIRNVIDETFTYLTTLEPDGALYLWAMAAVKDMHALWPSDAYVDYVQDFTSWRMKKVGLYKNTQRNYCSYVEGVASAYSVLETDGDVYELSVIKEDIDFWNKRNSFLQITEDDMYRYMLEGETLTLAEIDSMDIALGGFLTADNELTQRIDFTQHCVNAYLQTLVDIEGASL